MTQISIDPALAHSAASAIRNASDQLDGIRSGLSSQWFYLGSSWEGSSREPVEAMVRNALGNLTQAGEQTYDLGANLEAIAQRFEGADESVGIGLAAVAWKPFNVVDTGQWETLPWMLPVTEVPPLTYARLSQLAYSSDGVSPELARDGWERPEDLQLGKLLEGRQDFEGYSGVAFINRRTHQIVIAHRGTDDFNPFNRETDLDDDIEIKFGKVPDQYAVSREFVNKIKQITEQDSSLKGYTIAHTGHSLGGALADLNALTDNSQAITFDNPGTLQIVRNNPHLFPQAGRTNLVDYRSNPNLVHLMGSPAGYVVQIIPAKSASLADKASSMNAGMIFGAVGGGPFGAFAVGSAASELKATVIHHNLDNIVHSIDPQSGFPIGYFAPDTGKPHGTYDLQEFKAGRVQGANGAPACYLLPPLED